MDKNKKEKRPEIKDLAKEYLNDKSKLSQVQKIQLIYKIVTKKKPDPKISIDQVLLRVLYHLEYGKYIKATKNFLKNKKNHFKWSAKWKRVFKSSKKKASKNKILVWFLN